MNWRAACAGVGGPASDLERSGAVGCKHSHLLPQQAPTHNRLRLRHPDPYHNPVTCTSQASPPLRTTTTRADWAPRRRQHQGAGSPASADKRSASLAASPHSAGSCMRRCAGGRGTCGEGRARGHPS
eukprot:scaffold12959_cov116-Isochrysis_galbana.AAC.15